MVTMLVKDIPQDVWLCADDCNQVYMNKTLIPLNAFDYWILSFKVNRPVKNTRNFSKA